MRPASAVLAFFACLAAVALMHRACMRRYGSRGGREMHNPLELFSVGRARVAVDGAVHLAVRRGYQLLLLPP